MIISDETIERCLEYYKYKSSSDETIKIMKLINFLFQKPNNSDMYSVDDTFDLDLHLIKTSHLGMTMSDEFRILKKNELEYCIRIISVSIGNTVEILNIEKSGNMNSYLDRFYNIL